MAKHLVIFAATAMEMRAVFKGAGLEIPAPGKGEASFAQIRDIPVVLGVTGLGPLAAASMAGNFAGRGFFTANTCRGVLSLGIAGTYAPDVAPSGSIVVANREVWPEYGVRTDAGVSAEAIGFPLHGDMAEPSAVWNTISLDPESAFAAMRLSPPQNAPDLPENPQVTVGCGITVAGVSGSASVAGYLAATPGALFENMEGFPLALAALEAGIPFAEVRSISNVVGERNTSSWDIPASLAALSRATALIFGE